MLNRIARFALAAPRRVLALAALVMLATGIFGIPVIGSLSAGGMHDPNSESSQASALLAQKFGQGDMDMVITVTSNDGAQWAPRATAVGAGIVSGSGIRAKVAQVVSAMDGAAGGGAREYISKDGKTGVIVAAVNSGGKTPGRPGYASSLPTNWSHRPRRRHGARRRGRRRRLAGERPNPERLVAHGVACDAVEFSVARLGFRRPGCGGAAGGRRRVRRFSVPWRRCARSRISPTSRSSR